MSDKLYELIVDDEFSSLIRPLTSEEYRFLEENILRDGCREPITIWKGIILDGHNRYRICKRWDLPYRTTELDVSGRDEAMSWICANQLGRRNLSEEMRKYLIGKRYEIEKRILRSQNRSVWEPVKKADGSELSAQELYEVGTHSSRTNARMKNPTAEKIGRAHV